MAPVQQREAPHVVFGIDKNATMSEYRQAYLKQARRWHPDKSSATATPEENAEAHRRFHAIQEAWEEVEKTRGEGRDSMFGDLPPFRNEDPEKLRAHIANLRECLAFAEEKVSLLRTAAYMFADAAPTPPTSASKKGGKGRNSSKKASRVAAGIVTISDILEEEAAQKKKAKDRAEAALKYEEDFKRLRKEAAVAFGDVSTLKEQINNALAQLAVAIFIKESQERAEKKATEKSGEKPKSTRQGTIGEEGPSNEDKAEGASTSEIPERTFFERLPFRNGFGFLWDFIGIIDLPEHQG